MAHHYSIIQNLVTEDFIMYKYNMEKSDKLEKEEKKRKEVNKIKDRPQTKYLDPQYNKIIKKLKINIEHNDV